MRRGGGDKRPAGSGEGSTPDAGTYRPMSDAEVVSRWSRRFQVASVGFLLAWQALAVAGIEGAAVFLGLYGFVLHVVFAKAYSLVPSYFDRELRLPRAMPLQFGLTVPGVAALAGGVLIDDPSLTAAGGWLWLAGVAVFLAALVWTLRGNLSGAETGTGAANADRRGVDRVANAFVPVAFAYLLVGSYAMAAPVVGLPTVFDGYPPRATHLVAAGTAALLVFSVGFRLLPRFLSTRPPRVLVGISLAVGALGPLVLAASLGGGALFAAGAALEAVGFLGFAAAYAVMFVRTDRDRVGLYGVLGGVAAGIAGVALGLRFAYAGAPAELLGLHRRLNLLGFLGLTIVGVTYQFYPPAAGSFRGASDRTALASLVAIGGGIAIEAVGVVAGVPAAETLGRGLALIGALLYGGLLVGLFRDRYG